MRLILLTALTMCAFAANSLFNRVAVGAGEADAFSFAVVRLAAGAVTLAALLMVQRRGFAIGGARRVAGVVALLMYLFGFSMAYLALDAGLGALILFGVVQITMFSGALLGGEPLPPARWAGAGVALSGLAWLLWPAGADPVSLPHAFAMVLAGIGWGVYSLTGRGEADATQATAMNFLLALPPGVLLWLGLADAPALSLSGAGWAILSGALTSGLGYALWYALLPQLGAGRGALAQLTVPVIAIAAGVTLLGESADLRLVLAALLVLGGVVLGMAPRR